MEKGFIKIISGLSLGILCLVIGGILVVDGLVLEIVFFMIFAPGIVFLFGYLIISLGRINHDRYCHQARQALSGLPK